MFDIVNTASSYEREVICSFLQDFFQRKRSSLQLICKAHSALLLVGQSFGNISKHWKFAVCVTMLK